MVEVTCAGCSRTFEAKTRRAKWCEPACKVRTARRGGVATDEPATEVADDDSGEGLVATIRRELEAASQLATVDGQLALQLARMITQPGATGVATLTTQLRAVLESALANAAESQGVGEGGDAEDEVAKAREARERKAREASGRT